jgi:hypothetical protein
VTRQKRCWCCGRARQGYVELRGCSGAILHFGKRCGCAEAFCFEMQHAYEEQTGKAPREARRK